MSFTLLFWSQSQVLQYVRSPVHFSSYPLLSYHVIRFYSAPRAWNEDNRYGPCRLDHIVRFFQPYKSTMYRNLLPSYTWRIMQSTLYSCRTSTNYSAVVWPSSPSTWWSHIKGGLFGLYLFQRSANFISLLFLPMVPMQFWWSISYFGFCLHQSSKVIWDTSISLNFLFLRDINLLGDAFASHFAAEIVVSGRSRYTYCPAVTDNGALRSFQLWSLYCVAATISFACRRFGPLLHCSEVNLLSRRVDM